MSQLHIACQNWQKNINNETYWWSNIQRGNRLLKQ